MRAKIPLRQRLSIIWNGIKFLFKFGIALGGLLLLDEAGGTKLIIFALLAYIIAVYWTNKKEIHEAMIDIMVKLFG